jgi:DNA ligase-4
MHQYSSTVKVFDILLINGKTLLERSTEGRQKNLHNTVNEIKGRLEFATSWRGRTAKDIRDKMEQIMAARCVTTHYVFLAS